MKVTLVSIFLLAPFILVGQNNAVLANNDFNGMSLNNLVTIKDLENETDYRSRLIEVFGTPSSTKCDTNVITGTSCAIHYDGFELGFDFDTELVDIILTGSNYFLQYGPYQLKTGMSMSEVQIIFPNAYNKRYTTVFDSQTIHVVNLFVGNENSDTTFSLIYNPNTNTVTEIIIRFEPV